MSGEIQGDPVIGKHILFVDGECVFCATSAHVLHQMDRRARLYFAPLQGVTAQQLPENWRQLTDSDGKASGAAVVAENFGAPNVQYWRGADAPLRALKVIGGIWSVFWLLSYVPRPIKDWVYKIVARNRHRLTGKKESCSLPSEDFKARMLP